MKNVIRPQFDSYATFQEIFHSMSEGIIIVDYQGNILIANPIAEKMFEYEPGELVGKSLEQLLPERFRRHHTHLRKNFNEHPEPRRMGYGRDLTALKKNGDEFPVEISLSYTRAQGNLVVMAFVSDITQRKKAEEALRQSEEQLIVYAAELERKVQTRTEALNKSIIELEREVSERKKAEEEVRKSLEKERELNELKTKFVSIASHEFRTPLSTILSSASLVEQYKHKGDFDKIDKHTNRIKSSVNHLTAILNDFLSLGKLEEGKVELNVERVNLEALLEEVCEEMKASLKQGQHIVINYLSTIKIIESDARILRNILFNLLSNALKYSEANKNVFLNCKNSSTGVMLSVQDEGYGIPEEEQRHLFERFFRASNATNIQGTGLGLNIVRRYADLLHGTITFKSKQGEGSTFTVILPLK